ncbi:MAG TPA: hypothetical protein VL122_12510 [Nitrospirota bacterium]|nr:hypothetical protein [Nitrospirota bacterium]
MEQKDRFTRFGSNAGQFLLNNEGQDIEVTNEISNEKDEILQNLVLSSCLSAREFMARAEGSAGQKKPFRP